MQQLHWLPVASRIQYLPIIYDDDLPRYWTVDVVFRPHGRTVGSAPGYFPSSVYGYGLGMASVDRVNHGQP